MNLIKSFFTSRDPEQAGYSELFVTTGVIKLTLYMQDDNSPELWLLRTRPAPKVEKKEPPTPPLSPAHEALAAHDMHPNYALHPVHPVQATIDFHPKNVCFIIN